MAYQDRIMRIAENKNREQAAEQVTDTTRTTRRVTGTLTRRPSRPIEQFVSSMSKAKGFARTSKYAVVITPPQKINQGVPQLGIPGDPDGMVHSREITRQVNLHCNSVSMPGHDMQAQDVQHGSAPGRQMVQSHDYNGTIAASFYLDSHMRERHFFEQWQKMIVNKSTHKANYYDDYIGEMEIFQLDGNGEITYGIKAIEVYPTTIGGIEYAYANANQIATQAVSFQYRQWFNLTDKAIAGYRNSDKYNLVLKLYNQ